MVLGEIKTLHSKSESLTTSSCIVDDVSETMMKKMLTGSAVVEN
jgi:hypothetical protein